MRFHSLTERRLWLAAAVLLAVIYATLGLVRPLVETLRAHNLLRLSVVAVFVLAGAALAAAVMRGRPGRREAAVALGVAALYAAVLSRMERAEEAMHFLEYGAFAALVLAALAERRRAGPVGRLLAPAWAPAVWAAIGTAAAGWLDEAIQGLLPSRYYDVRDLAFNALAGLLAIGSLAALRAARAGDRAAAAD